MTLVLGKKNIIINFKHQNCTYHNIRHKSSQKSVPIIYFHPLVHVDAWKVGTPLMQGGPF